MPLQTQPLVLIVDDQLDIREITVEIVEDRGFRTLTAGDGRQALSLLQEMTELPSLILLDLMMPVMTGWQVAEELQRNSKLRSVPVVVMSAVAEDLVMPANVVGRLSKPELYSELDRILTELHKGALRVTSRRDSDRSVFYST